jgi:hypothetical protein
MGRIQAVTIPVCGDFQPGPRRDLGFIKLFTPCSLSPFCHD